MNENREDRLGELLGSLREDHRAPAHLKHDVMERVRAIPQPAWRRALSWLRTPKTLTLSPATAGGLAFAGLAILIAVWPGAAPPATGGAPAETASAGTATPSAVTRFVFVAPGASTVRMTGDFVAWDLQGIELTDPRGTGVWTVDVPLEPGVYQYTFIVDGSEWRPDPHAVSQVDDGFGQTNSVVIVPGGNAA